MRVAVILNPVAGGGRMPALWPRFEAALARDLVAFELHRTRRAGEAREIARTLALQGVGLILAAGGDGTIGETADGLMSVGGRAQLGVLPAGTGSDFVRSLPVGADPEAAVAAIASGRTRRIDVGRVSYVADDGSPAARHFVNIASLGLSGPTARAVNAVRQSGRPGGRLVFLYHTLAQLLRYRPQAVRMVFDDGAETIAARIAVVAAANGRFFGGGMMVAPDAALDDGLFDVVVFRAGGKLRLMTDLRLLYSGAHRDHPLVTIRRARKVVIEPVEGETPVLIDIDGESPGRAPATFEVLPGALVLRA